MCIYKELLDERYGRIACMMDGEREKGEALTMYKSAGH